MPLKMEDRGRPASLKSAETKSKMMEELKNRAQKTPFVIDLI